MTQHLFPQVFLEANRGEAFNKLIKFYLFDSLNNTNKDHLGFREGEDNLCLPKSQRCRLVLVQPLENSWRIHSKSFCVFSFSEWDNDLHPKSHGSKFCHILKNFEEKELNDILHCTLPTCVIYFQTLPPGLKSLCPWKTDSN